MKSKQIQQPEYNEKGVRYMMCNCGTYIAVGETATNVICGKCTNHRMMAKFPELHEGKPKRVSSGRPAGWHFMNEFVDKDGNVFHKGKEQPKLKGTLPPTKIKPKKKAKRRSKEEILLARHEKKKKVLKKAKKKLNDKIKRQ